VDYNVTYYNRVKVYVELDGRIVEIIGQKMMNNGSVMGHLAEFIQAENFKETHIHLPVKEKDFDSLLGERPLESKTFSKHGVSLGPSSFYGKNRQYDHEIWTATVPTKDFVISDTAECSKTGVLPWILREGSYIVNLPHKIPYSKRDLIFGKD